MANELSQSTLKNFMEAAQEVRQAAIRAVNSPQMSPVHAFLRQGADEITPALMAFPDSNIRPVSEPGQLFEPTAQLITEQMTGRTVDLEMDR